MSLRFIAKSLKYIFICVLIAAASILIYRYYLKYINENKTLKQIISRLEADSRIAEVLVTGVNFDEASQKRRTTIKFLEYNTIGNPLKPKYFTFSGNVIQFQSLVIRFDDMRIRRGDRLKGKSAYLFWKVFMLDGPRTEEYDVVKSREIPSGYKLGEESAPFEKELWEKFWDYALDPEKAKSVGIKNAQIEAPGTMFIPGMLYTVRIEHDGGMRIDTQKLPAIIRGETIPN